MCLCCCVCVCMLWEYSYTIVVSLWFLFDQVELSSSRHRNCRVTPTGWCVEQHLFTRTQDAARRAHQECGHHTNHLATIQFIANSFKVYLNVGTEFNRFSYICTTVQPPFCRLIRGLVTTITRLLLTDTKDNTLLSVWSQQQIKTKDHKGVLWSGVLALRSQPMGALTVPEREAAKLVLAPRFTVGHG